MFCDLRADFDRLLVIIGLAPGASHLVHMPSHTFMHTGHFDDAVAVNAAATYDA